jgi:hypothetical protein
VREREGLLKWSARITVLLKEAYFMKKSLKPMKTLRIFEK